MAVLSGLFVALFGRFLPRAWAGLCAVLAISFYTLLVGANPAVLVAGRAEAHDNWLSPSHFGHVELVSDGERMWVRVERR
jgi:hypothetical protein